MTHGLTMYLFSVIGAMLLWAKITAQKKRVNSFGDVIESMISNKHAQYVVQFIVFVLFGGMIGVLLTGPGTNTQALAAGMAWCRLTARD